jgi:hypothetical protein
VEDRAVALVDSVSDHLGPRSFVGFFDAVAGRMHVAGEDPFRSADWEPVRRIERVMYVPEK